jgi:selenocysteine lyase/cysteine desulfurase
MSDVWRRIRDEFPITASRAYLFAGGMAPLSRPSRDAIDAYARRWASDPTTAYRDRPDEDAAALRESIAALINCDAADLAILDSTSRGNVRAVATVQAGPRANVVVDSTTYPTALEPWHRREVAVRVVDGQPSTEAIARLVDERTAAVSVSHVCRLTGFRHDLAELSAVAHAAGAALLVDAAQSAGVVPLDVRAQGIDCLSFGAMKWLLGTPGVAFFYAPSGRSEELSSLAWPLLGACRAGLDLLRSVSAEAVERRVAALAGALVGGLLDRGVAVRTPQDPARRAGVVAFEVDRPAALVAACRERGVDVWGWDARRLVRADPHVYNDDADLARFFAAVDTYLSDN